MTKVPTDREVALGLIKSFLEQAEVQPELYRSDLLTIPVSSLIQIATTPEYLTEPRLREVAEQCEKAMFDRPNSWDDVELSVRIEKRRSWPRGTIHRFVYGTPHKAAA